MERFVTPCGAICKLITLISLLTGCSIPKYVPVETTSYDTVYVNKTIEYRDTVFRTSSADSLYAISDTTSHLESSYAISDASIIDNKLHHTLFTKDIFTKVKIPTITIDKESISFREKQIPYEVIVERKVTPSWVWWSLGVNIILIILIAMRIYIKLKTNV